MVEEVQHATKEVLQAGAELGGARGDEALLNDAQASPHKHVEVLQEGDERRPRVPMRSAEHPPIALRC